MLNISFHKLSNSMEDPPNQGGYNGDEGWGESDLNMDWLGCDTEIFENRTSPPGISGYKDHIDDQFTVFRNKIENDLYQNDISLQIQPCGDEFQKTEWIYSQKPEVFEAGNRSDMFSAASFDILNKYRSRCRRLNGENMNLSTDCNLSCGLSIEKMIQLAAENFILTTSQSSNDLSVLNHPYPGSVLCHLKEDYEGVHLIQNLLSCAERIGKKQYERTSKFLHECDTKSSPGGTPVQRLVFYFAEALHEKIDRETGRITTKGMGKKVEDPLEALQSPDSALIAFHKALPLSQITKFAGIQAVLDRIAEASKVHFIDFDIKKGIQCIILMQALASRHEHPAEHLKITAVGLGMRSKARIEETGRQLMSFAQYLGLNFSFNPVLVDNISDLNESLFQLDTDEAVAVNAAFTLTHMISTPDQLKSLMGVVKTINPCVMVIAEVEANCNSPVFENRFVEALFSFGAYFESMADCLKDDEKHRSLAERTCFSSSIRNIVAAEGDERKIRHVSIGVWRAFFMSFGLEEMDLSMSALFQAYLVLSNFTSGDSFTFSIDGKSLIIGWKGTPMSSLSTWKFKAPE